MHFTKHPVLHRHRRALLGHGALATLLAKKLICYQSTPVVANALHQTKMILLRGLAQPPYLRFYVRVFYLPEYHNPKIFAMLAVTPSDLIGPIVDKAIALVMQNSPLVIEPTLPVRLLCQGKILEEHKRVWDYECIQPHCTLLAQIHMGIRGPIGSRIPTTPHE
jgi:hypothetical protein